MKDAVFIDAARDEVPAFPDDVRREAGYQIFRLQNGEEPTDWKPMPSVGQGVREIRIHEAGEFRIIYVAKFEEAIYVLHGFQKKSQRTPKSNIELARKRYRALIATRKQS